MIVIATRKGWIKKSEAKDEKKGLTKCKSKTAHDARDFVTMFFGKAKFSIFINT
jgi:hypothetical protein